MTALADCTSELCMGIGQAALFGRSRVSAESLYTWWVFIVIFENQKFCSWPSPYGAN